MSSPYLNHFSDTSADRRRGLLLGACAAETYVRAPAERMAPDVHGGPTSDASLPACSRMIVACAGSLLTVGGFDGSDQAARLADAVRAERGSGFTVLERLAVGMFDDGAPWEEPGRVLAGTPGARSLDTAVRVLPGIVLASDHEPYRTWLVEQLTAITHASPAARLGSVVTADAAAAWLRDPSAPAPAVAAPDLASTVLEGSSAVALAAEVVGAVASSGGFADAVETVRRARTGSRRAAVLAGGLAGARWGAGAIPAAWLHPLEDQAQLVQLADELSMLESFHRRQRSRSAG